jgi:uncharacterized protein YciI
MAMFLVTRVPGRRWDDARSPRQQDGWDEHAAFMDSLVEDGFVILGGPVGKGDRFVLAVEANNAAEIEDRLADDPWEPVGVLRTGRIEPWALWLDGRGQGA